MGEANKTEKYNLFAILSLIFTFVFYPVGLVLGIIALNQIKKTKEKGRWMAWVSIGFASIMFLLVIVGILWAVVQGLIEVPVA